MRSTALTRAALGSLVGGTALMVGLESGYARVAGVILLVAFIVLGALAIATPEYLAREVDDDS